MKNSDIYRKIGGCVPKIKGLPSYEIYENIITHDIKYKETKK